MNTINSNIAFTQSYISKIKNKNGGKTPLNFVEYETGFYDLLHIKDEAKTPESKKIFGAYCDAYVNGDFTKRFYGVEDSEGKIYALCEAKVNDNKESENYGSINPVRIAPLKSGSKNSLAGDIKAEIKKHSKKCNDILRELLNKRGKSLSITLDKDGHIVERYIDTSA